MDCSHLENFVYILNVASNYQIKFSEISERRKKKQIESMVPDLDDMESGDLVMDN